MPLYEYACEKCGKVFEVLQKFVDEPLRVHAECGGKVDRLLSAPALHFKGSGFYVNDYAKGTESSNAPSKHGEGRGHSEGSSDGSKSDGSKSEGSKSDGSKSEGSKSEGSKSEGSRSEGSRSEGSRSEGSKSEGSKSDSGSSNSSSESSSKPAPATNSHNDSKS